jgi:hypothetical protein
MTVPITDVTARQIRREMESFREQKKSHADWVSERLVVDKAYS